MAPRSVGSLGSRKGYRLNGTKISQYAKIFKLPSIDTKMPKKKELKEIKGWLLLILIIFIISAAFKTFGLLTYFYVKSLLSKTLEKLSSSNEAIKAIYDTISNNIFITTISLMFLVVLTIFLWYTVYLIFKRKEKAKNIAIITLWIGFASSLSAAIINILYIPKITSVLKTIHNYSDTTLALTQTYSYIKIGFSLAISLTWVIIWTLYFKKSKRVQQTLIEK